MRVSNWLGLAIPLAVAGPAGAQTRAASGKPAEAVYKNIKALRGMPAAELDATMRYMSAALGVGCDFCHVTSATGNWPMEKDDKDEKGAARRMIAMTQAINKDNFKGKLEVTCATCHHGRNEPMKLPPTAAPVEEESVVHSDTPLPGLDEILEHNLKALGGKDALARVKTRTIKAVLETTDGHSIPLEMQGRAPNQVLTRLTLPNGVAERAYDGRLGWMRNPDGSVGDLDGIELADTRRMGLFLAETTIKERFKDVKVRARVKLGDKEVFLVDARGEGHERLYFDVASGLLDRAVVLTRTPLGELPDRIDYSDYRTVDGIQVPFAIKRGQRATVMVSEAKFNEALDDARFQKPAGK
jgi:hypothetical protein